MSEIKEATRWNRAGVFMSHSDNLLRRCCLLALNEKNPINSRRSAHAKLPWSKPLHAAAVMWEQRAKVKSDTLGCVGGAAIHAVSIYTYFMRLSHPLVSQHGSGCFPPPHPLSLHQDSPVSIFYLPGHVRNCYQATRNPKLSVCQCQGQKQRQTAGGTRPQF